MTRLSLASVVGAALLAGCTVGPDYRRPAAVVPAAGYKDTGWKVAQPRDAADRGDWWTVYDDPLLNELEKQVDISNQTLRASEAAYRAATALVQQARAGYFPTVGVSGGATRSGSGGGAGRTSSLGSGGRVVTTYDLSADASWTPDLWGRVRRTVESQAASAQASAADLALARLSAQSQLASAYLELRVLDEQKRLLDASVDAYAQSLQITRNQYFAGTAARPDVAQAETQLRNTQAQAINLGVRRAQLENAIGVLIGKPPSEFAIAPAPIALETPAIPAGLPSTLLERRPDIAAAERTVAAANARIGVAQAAFYPTVTLSAAYGFSAIALGNLFAAAGRSWSLGSGVAETIFDGGARTAAVAEARATYDQTVASYRQTVLSAFQEVENQLSAQRVLAEEAQVQREVVRTAREAERLILNQYRAGTVPYTNVIVAQTAALSAEQNQLAVRLNRLTGSVALIQALGGGWHDTALPSREELTGKSFIPF